MKRINNFSKGIRSTMKGSEVSDREELKNMIYKMIEKSHLYKKLKEPDVYDDRGTKIYLKELLEITGYMVTISENFIVDSSFVKSIKKLTELNESREQLNKEILKINKQISEKKAFIDSESNTQEEIKENVRREIEKLEKELSVKKGRYEADTKTVNEISEKVLDRIENLKKNCESDCKELMFLKALISDKDVDFDIEDVKNLAFHLYRSGNSANMKATIQNFNAIFGQADNILDLCERYFMAEKLITEDYFNNMYEAVFSEANADLSQYDNKIDSFITEDLSYRDRSFESTVHNEDNTVSIRLSVPHYWSLLKSLQLIKDMKNAPKTNKNRILEFKELLNSIETDNENNNVENTVIRELKTDDIGEEVSLNNNNNEEVNEKPKKENVINEEKDISNSTDKVVDKKKNIVIKRINSYIEKKDMMYFNLLEDYLKKNVYLINDEEVRKLIYDSKLDKLQDLIEKYGDN